MEVETKTVLKTLGILKRFSDPSDFIPASRAVIFEENCILLTAVWGGCLYMADDTFLKPTKPMAMDTSLISDLLTLLQVRKSETMKVEYDETSIAFLLSRSKVTFGVKEIPMPWRVSELLGTGPEDITQAFLPALSSLAFSISDNAYKSQFGGIWYSEEDKKIYASDNQRITCLPLKEPLGTGGNFFVPAVFLKKMPSLGQPLLGIQISGNLCLFYYDGFVPFFLIRDIKMPPFMSAFSRARESAVESTRYFKLAMTDKDREDIVSLKPLFYDEGGSADVRLTGGEDTLVIEVLHKQDGGARGFTEALPLLEKVGEVNFRMDAQFFLEAIGHFDTFHLDPGKSIYARKSGGDMEQLISWKG